MGFDFGRFAERRKTLQTKGFGGKGKRRGRREIWKPARPGYHGIYICPPTSGMEGLPFVPIVQHYAVGGNRSQIHPCFGPENVGLWMPAAQAALERKNKRVADSGKPEWTVNLTPDVVCPTCDELISESSSFGEKDLSGMAPKSVGLFNVVPIFFGDLDSGEREMTPLSDQIPRPWLASERLTDEVCNLIAAQRIDITDPEAAVVLIIKRVGKTWNDTRYSLSLDGETLRTPMKVSPPIRSQLKHTETGGPLDLFDWIAGSVRDLESVRGWLGGGLEIDETSSDTPPACYEKQCDPDDTYCQDCAFKVPCAKACGVRVPGEKAEVDLRPPSREVPKPDHQPEPVTPSAEAQSQPESAAGGDDFMAAFEAELARATTGE